MLALPHIHQDTEKICIHIFAFYCVMYSSLVLFCLRKGGILDLFLSSLLTPHSTLTQLLLSGPFFHKGDSLQDSPEHHTQGEDVRLGCVGQSAPHFWSHVEVRATGGREVLPGQITVHQTFTHLAQTKVCHLEFGEGDSLKEKHRMLIVGLHFFFTIVFLKKPFF